MKCRPFTEVIIIVSHLLVEIETKDITIGNTVGDGVLVQHVSEQRPCSNLIMSILFKHGGAGETK